MKKCGLILVAGPLVLSLAAHPVVAQVTWELGFKGGVGAHKLTGDTGFSDSFDAGGGTIVTVQGDLKDSRTGFTGGAFATAMIKPSYGIRIEGLYSQKGGKGDVNFFVDGVPAGTEQATFEFNYVEFPILLVGSFPAAGKGAKLQVLAGPTIGFKTTSQLKEEFEGQSDKTDITGIKGTDFGATLGLGARVPASEKVGLLIDGRYTFGLTNTVSDGTGTLKNGGFSFTVGLSFPLGSGGTTP
jgi:hypothetical protein